jgi:hypothetical protein
MLVKPFFAPILIKGTKYRFRKVTTNKTFQLPFFVKAKFDNNVSEDTSICLIGLENFGDGS